MLICHQSDLKLFGDDFPYKPCFQVRSVRSLSRNPSSLKSKFFWWHRCFRLMYWLHARLERSRLGDAGETPHTSRCHNSPFARFVNPCKSLDSDWIVGVHVLKHEDIRAKTGEFASWFINMFPERRAIATQVNLRFPDNYSILLENPIHRPIQLWHHGIQYSLQLFPYTRIPKTHTHTYIYIYATCQIIITMRWLGNSK